PRTGQGGARLETPTPAPGKTRPTDASCPLAPPIAPSGKSMMQRHVSIGRACAASAAAGLMILTLPVRAQSPKIGDPPEARNMRLVGYNDWHGRSAYQPTTHHQGSRYIAYIGHHGGTPEVPRPVNRLTGQAENNGTSIVDVTDPAQPKYLAHIP